LPRIRVMDVDCVPHRAFRRETGQTTTEYLMVGAVLAAVGALLLKLWPDALRLWNVGLMHYVKSIAF
jgi:hypothetical protein